MLHSGTHMIAMYKLTSISIGTIPLLLKPITPPRFILRRHYLFDTFFILPMREVTLNRQKATFSA